MNRSRALPTWLPAALDYVPRWIEFQMRLLEQPGCVVAVAHRGEVVLEVSFGAADLERATALTPRHRFRVASQSKTFTAAGIMKLRESGALSLDDRVGKHVPGLHDTLAEVRLAHLLAHGAGVVRDGPTADQWLNRRPFADAEDLSAALTAPPTLEASTRFKYSNFGYGLLGRVIEAVTHEPYAAWMEREVVRAAGLSETTPDMPVGEGVPMASGYSSRLPLGRRVVLPAHQPTHALAAATGFVSTARDLARFFAQLSPTADVSLLSRSSRREMTHAQWRNPDSAIEIHYGLGTMSGGKGDWWWFGHHGGFQGFISRTVVVPAHDLAIAIVTNAIDGQAVLWVAGMLQVLATFARHGVPSERTRDWTGRWWTIWGVTDLVPMGDKVLAANPGLPFPFADASEIAVASAEHGTVAKATGFENHGEPVERIRDVAGRFHELRLGNTTLVPEERVATELLAGVANPDGRR